MKAISVFNHITIDGIGYFEPEDRMTYDEAMKWAKTRGLRLLTRGEWCLLWDTSIEFRESTYKKSFWTSTVCEHYENKCWYVYGSYGNIYFKNRNSKLYVRAEVL